jgi:hypothetical protein
LLKKLNENENENKFYFCNTLKHKEVSIEKENDIKKLCKNYETYTKGKNKTSHYGIAYDLKNQDAKAILIVHDNIIMRYHKNELTSFGGGQKELDGLKNKEEGHYYPIGKGQLNFKKFDDTVINNLTGKNRQKTIDSLVNEFKELVNKLENK